MLGACELDPAALACSFGCCLQCCLAGHDLPGQRTNVKATDSHAIAPEPSSFRTPRLVVHHPESLAPDLNYQKGTLSQKPSQNLQTVHRN